MIWADDTIDAEVEDDDEDAIDEIEIPVSADD